MKLLNHLAPDFISILYRRALALGRVSLALSLLLLCVAPLQAAITNGKIAFYSKRDGNYEIYSMNADGSNQTRLTNTTAADLWPAFSPDGRRIAFQSNRDGNYEIYSMNADGSEAANLTNNASDEGFPCFSPDGSKIVFTSERDGNIEIYSMNADGSGQINLTNHAGNDRLPRFSPNGSRIVFASDRDGNDEVYVMNADGSNQTRLTNQTGIDTHPCFSPDGGKIAFSSDRDGYFQVFIMNADGGNPINMTNRQTQSVDYMPRYSPDSSKITFASSREGNFEIYTMNTDGSNPLRLTTTTTADEQMPDWGMVVGGELSVSSTSPQAEGNSGGANIIAFTVKLSEASTSAVAVRYRTVDNTAKNGSDYLGKNGVLTFAPGETTQTIKISLTGDTLRETDENFFFELTLPTGAVIAPVPAGAGRAMGTIVNDDSGPTVSVNDVSISEGSSGTSDLIFTITLNAISGQDVRFNYATATNTAAQPADYTAISGTITIPVGQTSATVAVPIKGDVNYEPNETFNLVLSNPVNATLGDAQGTGTILNDDAKPTLSINDIRITESNGGSTQAAFTLTLSAFSSQPITVAMRTAGSGSPEATSGSDYTAVPSTAVTIPPGQASKTVNVTLLGDIIDEADETFAVNLSGAVNAAITDNTGICTIVDNDLPPAINVSASNVTEGNVGETATMTFTLSLSAASARNVSVQYQTGDALTVPATAGTDYAPVTITTVIFAAGQTSKTVSVTVKGDVLDEDNERIALKLTNPVNASLGTINDGIIVDDDATPSLSINDASIVEGRPGTWYMAFTVTLSAVSGRTVSVYAQTANGGTPAATANLDYTALSPTLITFAPGQTSKPIDIAIKGDWELEGNEKFLVTLSGYANASISDNAGVGTIIDDDAAGAAVPEASPSGD